MDATACGQHAGDVAAASPPPPPPSPDAETWRLLQELPLDLLHAILCIADALEQLQPLRSGVLAAQEAAQLLCRVSLLSRWHRWAARSVPLRLRLCLPRPAQANSYDFQLMSQQLLAAVLWATMAPTAAVEVTVGGPLLAAAFAQHSLVLSTRDAAFLRRIQDLSLAGTHVGEAPYPRLYDAAQLPDLPCLHTLRLLYFRGVHLAGLAPHVRHVHLLMAGMQMRELGSQTGLVAGRCLAPLASLPAGPLCSLRIGGNTGPLQVEGTELLLNLEQLCRAAHEVEVRCHCVVLACPAAGTMRLSGNRRLRHWQACDRVERLLSGCATTAARLRLAFREVRWIAAPGGGLPTGDQLAAAASFFFVRTAVHNAERAEAAGDAHSAAVWRQWGQQAEGDVAPAQGLVLVSPTTVAAWGEPPAEAEFVASGEPRRLRLHRRERRRRRLDRLLLGLGRAATLGAIAGILVLWWKLPADGYVWQADGRGWRPKLEMLVWKLERLSHLSRQQQDEVLRELAQLGSVQVHQEVAHRIRQQMQKVQEARQEEEREKLRQETVQRRQETVQRREARRRRCVAERRFGTTSQLLVGAAKASLAALCWQ